MVTWIRHKGYILSLPAFATGSSPLAVWWQLRPKVFAFSVEVLWIRALFFSVWRFRM